MLSRPGCGPGSTWMQRASDALADPVGSIRWMKWFWAFFAVFMVLGFGLNHFVANRSALDQPYESAMHVGRLPLLSIGPHACGIIALGGSAIGVIAFGGLAVGAIAVGGLALGGIALSGVTLAIFAIGGCAMGWRAVGGGALGYYALGGLAVGGHAYAGGGVAIGYNEASGRQRERLFG